MCQVRPHCPPSVASFSLLALASQVLGSQHSAPVMFIEHSFGYSCAITAGFCRSQPHINTSSGPLAIASIPRHSSPLLTPFFYSNFLFLSHFYPSSMKTRTSNQGKHPAASVMTPTQLAAAGIPAPLPKKKKPTKDQRIAALEEDLRVTRELLQMVSTFFPPPCSLAVNNSFSCRITSLWQVAALALGWHCHHSTTVATQSQQPTTTTTVMY